MNNDLKKYDDEMLGKMITEKYGEGWTVDELDDDDPLVIEFADRLARGE